MRLPRSLIWTGIAHLSTEFLTIRHVDRVWRIEGRIITEIDERPCFTAYTLICDEIWQTRHVTASCRHDEQDHALSLHRDDDGWIIDGVRDPALDPCVDIDIELSPFTNSLPIKRLNLDIGQQSAVEAAWLRFPALTLERLPQRYLRVSPNRYRYEAGDSFTAMLDVDDDGMVIRYEGLWERHT